MDYIRIWHTVVELPEYERKASKLLNASEKQAIMKQSERNKLAGLLRMLVKSYSR